MNNVIKINFSGNDFTVQPLEPAQITYTKKRKEAPLYDLTLERKQQDMDTTLDALLCDHCEQDAFMSMAGYDLCARDAMTAEYREQIKKILEKKDA